MLSSAAEASVWIRNSYSPGGRARVMVPVPDSVLAFGCVGAEEVVVDGWRAGGQRGWKRGGQEPACSQRMAAVTMAAAMMVAPARRWRIWTAAWGRSA